MGQTISATYSLVTDHEDCRPTGVTDLLQGFEAMMRLNPLITGFERSADGQHSTSFGGGVLLPTTGYTIHERIPLIPWLGLTIPITTRAWFYRTDDGLFSHVEAPLGLTFKTNWYVEGDRIRETVAMHGRRYLLEFSKKEALVSHEKMMVRLVEKAGGKITRHVLVN